MIFKQVFRIAFVTLIWKQYKAIIVSTLLLFIYLFLVSSVHADFLTHAELQKDASGSGLSFLYKWLAFTIGVAAYFLFHYLRGRPKKKSKQASKSSATINKKEINATESDDDPFAAIRERQKLRSRADFLDGKE